MENGVFEVHIEDGNSRGRREQQGPNPQRIPPDHMNEEDEMEEEFKYGAVHVIKLLVPVSLCMLVVAATINSIIFYTTKGTYLVYTPFHEETPDSGTKAWQAIANSLILMGVVVFMTVILIILSAQECNESIFPALIYSSTVMYAFTMIYSGYVTAATMASGYGNAEESVSSPDRFQNPTNSVSSDNEESGFTRERVETHGIIINDELGKIGVYKWRMIF